jgi:hypothetical protein
VVIVALGIVTNLGIEVLIRLADYPSFSTQPPGLGPCMK